MSNSISNDRDTLKYINEYADEFPEQFFRSLCKHVLGNVSSSDYFENELLRIERECDENNSVWIDRNRAKYTYFAKLVLNKADRLRTSQLPYFNDPAYQTISLRDHIERDFYFSYKKEFDYKSCHPVHIWNGAFQKIQSQYSEYIDTVVEDIYFGLPVYEKQPQKEGYKLLDTSNEDYCFLKMKGKYKEGYSGFEPPEWSDRLYFKPAHHSWAHRVFDYFGELSEDELINQKNLFYSAIDFKRDSSLSNVSDTENQSSLMKLQNEVIKRYYGVNYDPNDSDTWPKQNDIKDWLMKEHNLSERESIAIDIVTRPDKARGK